MGGFFALLVRAAWIPTLVSFAIGALLGAAFLEVIPHAFEHGAPQTAAGAILAGILGFFLLEKLLIWRHSHDEDGAPHAHPHEQILLLLSGRATLGDEVREVGPGTAIHIPPNVPHAIEMIEDSDVVSCKGIVGGVGHRI